jgi:phospholipid transport system transporter-binding protein
MITESKVTPEGSHLLVSGVLSFATVSDVRSMGNELLKNISEPVFDLKGVTSSDSAALALLSAWAREAKRLGRSVRFINVPTSLMHIALLSNLEKVLSLSEGDNID